MNEFLDMAYLSVCPPKSRRYGLACLAVGFLAGANMIVWLLVFAGVKL